MGLYKTVFETATALLEIKKSKFIAEIRHIETGKEALLLLKEFKKRYYDATHNCSAYVLRSDNGLRHSSDDGEPSGTAGKPMLDVLIGEGLSDVLVVVTRYYGGTKLGTGGLVRAYQGAVKDVLSVSEVVEINEGLLVEFQIDYSLLPKITYLCKELNVIIYESLYLEEVRLRLLIEPDIYGKFVKELTEVSAGSLVEETIENKAKVNYYVTKSEIVKIL